MTKINVLHFTLVINRHDFIDVIIRYSDKSRFQQQACVMDDKSNIAYHDYPKDGIPYHDLKVSHSLVGYLKAVFKLARILRKEKIDILHTHHFYESFVGMLAVKLAPGTKHIFGRHYHEEFYITASGWKLKWYLWLEGLINKSCAAIISPSTLINQLLIKQGVKPEKIYHVPYGFEFDKERYQLMPVDVRAEKRSTYGWQNQYLVGNFGRHHPIKGQEYLLEAFAVFSKKYPDAKLVMVGAGPIHEQLLQKAKELNLAGKVEFMGWRRDGHELMKLMDVIVHPTLQEAFPQTMIEVMSVEVPLIITPVSGVTDVVQNCINGFVIPFRNSEKIAETLEWVKGHPEESKHIALEARQYVLKNLDIHNVIKQYEQVYIDLTSAS